MNPQIDREVGAPALEQDHALENNAPVVTGTSAALDQPETEISLDSLENEPAPAPAPAGKALARPDQVMRMEENKDAIAAMKESGFVRGRAIDEFLESGNAANISEANAKRIIGALNKAQGTPAPQANQDVTLGGDPVPASTSPDYEPGAEPELQETQAWNAQPASDGMIREMNRVNGLRGEAIAAAVATWQGHGLAISVPSVEGANKGDFKTLKAAEQAALIQSHAAERLNNWDSIRANAEGVPYEPVSTVGQYCTAKVTKQLDLLTQAPQSVKDAVLADREVMALASAAQAKNTMILDGTKKEGSTFKPNLFDYAPNMERSLEFAIAANPGLEPEAIVASVKTAYSAGTIGMLYKIADAMEIKDVRKVELREPRAPKPEGQQRTQQRDPDWAVKPIDSRDAERLTKAVAEKGFDALPD